ncbi:hypothetical protein VTO42DRAFT_4658 [Malbranchea cinnamomea]
MSVDDNGSPMLKTIEPTQVPSSKPSALDQILAKLSPKENTSASSASVNKMEIPSKPTEHKETKMQYFAASMAGEATTSSEAYIDRLGPVITSAGDAHTEATIAEDDKIDKDEVTRLREELMEANTRIALQEQELAQTRVIKQTLEQAMGPPSEADFSGREVTEQTISCLQTTFNAATRPYSQRSEMWMHQDDAHSDISEALSAGGYNRARGIWNIASHPSLGPGIHGTGDSAMSFVGNPAMGEPIRDWGSSRLNSQESFASNQRVFSGPGSPPPFGFDNRYTTDNISGLRRSITQVNRGGSCFSPQNTPWGTFPSLTPGGNSVRPATHQQFGQPHQVGMYPGQGHYQPRPIGTPLSPTAAEFTSLNSGAASWGSSAASGPQTYVSPLEPLNYRRLLDKSVSCDWKYIVDKIVCNNDQQASIFLQQKLKVGTAEQKYEIVEAIVNQAYPLMVNRFGNFLVQRCFEHGTPEQVVAIANAIRGNTISLSMDPFGCHVIQKAFDCVPEEHKAAMVHELLRRIPETVIHRYACHVWQKLFELRWSGEPPQIMAKVNEALRGMWHEVALGETGSLVVQNIFENCVEDEKRPAIEEVLAKIDLLAHGQFGNWCIQHICEHGAPHDKSRAIEHILVWATDYSMDQFASKVVEKCLKIGGNEFLDRYLARVCTGRPDRPRMPLIDIAGDQYGNYLIQWILMNAGSHHRELVASHIRKHMVSLRGSKFGSRVAMLCCNPNHVTRPGPGAGIHVGRYGNPNDERFPMGMSGGRLSNRGSQWGSNYPPFR